MGRRGRKKMMSEYPVGKARCFFDGITLVALHKCEPPYELSPEKGEAWERMKTFLSRQKYTVWCSQRSWENFLKYTIERNKLSKFYGELREKVKEYSDDLYLTYEGRLKTARSLTRWDW